MKTPQEILRKHCPDTSVPMLESQVVAAMVEYHEQFECKHEFTAVQIKDRSDYGMKCVKCGFTP